MIKIIFNIFFLISIVNASSMEDNSCQVSSVGELEVGFEGYKTNFKAGISGSFTGVEHKYISKSAKNISELLIGSSVIIDKKSVATSMSSIAENLVEFFFNKMDDDKISAKILNVKPIDPKTRRGDISVDISMNHITKNVDMTYFVKSNIIFATGTINLPDFNATEALSSLNKACFDEHLGKTWSDVGINFKIPIEKVCK